MRIPSDEGFETKRELVKKIGVSFGIVLLSHVCVLLLHKAVSVALFIGEVKQNEEDGVEEVSLVVVG